MRFPTAIGLGISFTMSRSQQIGYVLDQDDPFPLVRLRDRFDSPGIKLVLTLNFLFLEARPRVLLDLQKSETLKSILLLISILPLGYPYQFY